MILGGLNQEFHQTLSSKERISLILSEVGESYAVKCVYSINKSAMALKLLQQDTKMQGKLVLGLDELPSVVGVGPEVCEMQAERAGVGQNHP